MGINWSGKTAIITGASGGIGESIAEKLANMGMNLVLTGRNVEKLEKVKNKAISLGAKVWLCSGDLSDVTFLDRLIQETMRAFGSIDVLVNNAGLPHNCSVTDMVPELFDRIMAVNVRAPYFLSQKAVPYLKASGCGTVINICSVVAHKGYPFQSVYAASKHALLGFSKSFANEVYNENIRVHVISPGGVYTDMVAFTRPDLTPEGMILSEDIGSIVAFYLNMRHTNAVVDEIELHRVNKAPFA